MRTKSIFTRLKYSFYYIFGIKKEARIMTCGNCGSTLIKGIKDTCKQERCDGTGVDLYWEEKCRCIKCGATCREIQMWTFPKNESAGGIPKEI